jgi:flagellar protein FliO/FliZ
MKHLPATAVLLPLLLGARTAAAQSPAVDAGDVTSMILSLIVVLALILAAAWVFKRAPFSLAQRGDGPLRIVATLPLGPKERLLLVEARGREVLVAVGQSGIAVLAPGAPAAAAPGVDDDALKLAASFVAGGRA